MAFLVGYGDNRWGWRVGFNVEGAEADTGRSGRSLTPGRAAIQLGLRVWVGKTLTSLESSVGRRQPKGK